jgi:hypothetical protein
MAVNLQYNTGICTPTLSLSPEIEARRRTHLLYPDPLRELLSIVIQGVLQQAGESPGLNPGPQSPPVLRRIVDFS